MLKEPSLETSPDPLPLVLDLDGTLIHTDTFHEMMSLLFFKKPWILFLLPFWFLRGRPYAKRRLASFVSLSPHNLPYNIHLLNFAKEEMKKGRSLILATGTDQKVAEIIADYLGIFKEVIGSNGIINMTGPRKQQALIKRFGLFGFDYAGDSQIDLHVWHVARKAIVVYPKRGVFHRILALKGAENIHYFPKKNKEPG